MDHLFAQFPLFVRATWSTGMTAWAEDSADDGHHLARQRRVASIYCDDWIEEEEPTPWILTFILLGKEDDFRVPLAFLAIRSGINAESSIVIVETGDDAARGRDDDDAAHGRDDDNDAARGRDDDDDDARGRTDGNDAHESSDCEDEIPPGLRVRVSTWPPPISMDDLGSQYDEFDDFFGCYSW